MNKNPSPSPACSEQNADTHLPKRHYSHTLFITKRVRTRQACRIASPNVPFRTPKQAVSDCQTARLGTPFRPFRNLLSDRALCEMQRIAKLFYTAPSCIYPAPSLQIPPHYVAKILKIKPSAQARSMKVSPTMHQNGDWQGRKGGFSAFFIKFAVGWHRRCSRKGKTYPAFRCAAPTFH